MKTKTKKSRAKKTATRKVVEKTVMSHQLRLTMVGQYRISTVDLHGAPAMVGLMDAFFGTGAGQRFETMVFDGDDNHDLDKQGYSSRDLALAGHDAMVAKWRTFKPEAAP